MTESLRWDPQATERSEAPLPGQPMRLLLAVGGGIALVGTFLPWREGRLSSGEPVSFSAMSTADGVLLQIIAVVMVGLGMSRAVAGARSRALQAALLVLGGVSTLLWLNGLAAAQRPVTSLEGVAWQDPLGTGIWVTGAGVALLATVGAILSIRAWRTVGAAPDPQDVLVTRRSVVRAVVEAACGVGGMSVGLIAAVNATGPIFLAAMGFGTIAGGAVGLALGHALARRI